MKTCEGRALTVVKAVLPSYTPPGYASVGLFIGKISVFEL